MKGVTILTDEKKRRKILQVDIKEIAKNPDDFEDLIDILVAESRKNEPKKSWEEVKKTSGKKENYKFLYTSFLCLILLILIIFISSATA